MMPRLKIGTTQGWYLRHNRREAEKIIGLSIESAQGYNEPLTGERCGLAIKKGKEILAAVGLEAFAGRWYIREAIAQSGWKVAWREKFPLDVPETGAPKAWSEYRVWALELQRELSFYPTNGIRIVVDPGQKIHMKVPAMYSVSPYLRGLTSFGGRVECFHREYPLGLVEACLLLDATRVAGMLSPEDAQDPTKVAAVVGSDKTSLSWRTKEKLEIRRGELAGVRATYLADAIRERKERKARKALAAGEVTSRI
ncbi:MAG: hypothetical protein ACXABY_09160 [Candidatus Thorarchaeota archaeon]|jgi:hypothetical protein